MVLANFIPLKISTLTFLLNVILLVIGYVFIGKEFGVKTVLTSLMLPMYLRIFEIVTPNVESLSGNIVIDLACFMVLISSGQALLFNMNASSGGVDIVAKLLNKYLGFKMGESLTIHLSQKQNEKKASVVIEGEGLDVLVGTKPLSVTDDKEEKDLVKATILQYLKENYDMEEEDFLSAELEVVPAGKARECGLDRSMIMGYGQDDRVCAFTSLFAMLEAENVERTACCILVDKEEISSAGATSMHSRFFEDTVAELVALTEGNDALKVRRTLHNSFMLSSDVSAAYDPLYESAFEKKNTAYFGRGLVLNKYTGSRGKVSTNDANAEYVAKVRNVLDNNGVGFQTAEMGKVDLGGGGTIAYIMANYGMNVIDSGVAVLSMHAPNEVTSKSDIYEVYRGYKAFLKDMK